MPLVPDPKNCDISVKRAIQGLSKKLGYTASPTFVGMTFSGLTASTLIGADASKALESVTVGTGLDYTRPDLTLSHLGIEALTDPGADKILFWDNSETACKWLGVGNSIAITTTTLDTIQDIRTTASPTFANLSLGTGELTCGSINRAAGTLTLEINGTAEISITATASTFGGNIILPDAGQIGSTSDTNAITISAIGIVDITAHDGSAAGLSLGGTLVTSTAAELNLLDGLTGVQAQGAVLDDLNTLGAPASDGQFIVATGAGVFAYESTTTARTSLGVGTGDSPAFTAVSLGTGELTCGSINRTTGTLTLEIGGTAEVSITATTVTLGGNLIIPDSGTIGSASDTDVMTIDASGNCTFSVFPITPSAAPDADYEVANKKYVLDNVGGGFSSRISVYLGSDQSITKETWTQIQLDTETYDNDGEFASYKFTADEAGYYHATGKAQFNGVVAGKEIYVSVRKNGSNYATILDLSTGLGYDSLQIDCDVYLNGSTDYLDVAVYHNDTVNRNISGAIADTNFFVHRFA